MNKKRVCVLLLALDLLLFTMLLFSWNFQNKNDVTLTFSSQSKDVSSMKNEKNNEQKQEKGKIALTFDDGPYPNYTRQLLEGLQERNVKATFFVQGQSAEEYPDVIELMHEEGHLIGNHTYHHVELTKVGADEFKKEVLSTNELLYKLTGEYPQFIRPPFGAWEKKLDQELGMIPVLWTVDPLDWCTDDSQAVVQRVVTNVKENDIILLHDCYKSSVTAALQIVDILKEEGYEFVTVDEILIN